MRTTRVMWLIGVLLCLSMPSASQGYTWRVYADGHGPNPTIQAAIDRAESGDSVLVYPGTYYQAINFSGKDIRVLSAAGPEVTVIDGSQAQDHVVVFEGHETRGAGIEGFTITGAHSGYSGIRAVASQPTILGNVITGNEAELGGGISCNWDGQPGPWSPLIKNNVIAQNTAEWTGGGLYIFGAMSPEIVGNEIIDNRAIRGDGGGIYYNGLNDAGTISDNLIAGNHAGDHGGGVMVAGHYYYAPLAVEISYNLIVANVAEGQAHTGDSGGGVCLTYSASWIHHNTFANNAGSSFPDAPGGAVSAEDVASPIIEHNILASTISGGGIYCLAGATATIRNNLVWENLPAHGAGLCDGWVGVDGNIEADPEFCNPSLGDYTVAVSSPALSHEAGPLGAFANAGCQGTPVRKTTWGRIKQQYD